MSIVLEDGTVVAAAPRKDAVTLLAHDPQGNLLAVLRMTPEQVDDLVHSLWGANAHIVREAIAA